MDFTSHLPQSDLAAGHRFTKEECRKLWGQKGTSGSPGPSFSPGVFIPLWKLSWWMATGLCWYSVLGTHYFLGSGGSFAYILLQEALCSQQSWTQLQGLHPHFWDSIYSHPADSGWKERFQLPVCVLELGYIVIHFPDLKLDPFVSVSFCSKSRSLPHTHGFPQVKVSGDRSCGEELIPGSPFSSWRKRERRTLQEVTKSVKAQLRPDPTYSCPRDQKQQKDRPRRPGDQELSSGSPASLSA